LLFMMSNFNLSNSDALLLNGEGTQNRAENQLLDSRTATGDNTKLPEIMTFPEFPNSTDDGNVKLLDHPVREDNNTASFMNEYSPDSFQDLLSFSNEFHCDFEKNGNIETHPCNWPPGIFDEDGLTVNDSNILQGTEGTDGSRWSAFSPVFDFNAETYLNSVPEMVHMMNDQYTPQNDAYADDGNRDYNNQKQLMAEQVSNMDVPLFTDHLTQNVCTTSNEFTSPSGFIQNFQQNENGLHIENSQDLQIQSDTFEAASEFLIDNVMETFPESTLGIHPFEHSSAPSNVVHNTAKGVDGSRWSASSPVFDFNAETYLNSVPEMVQMMNDQYPPQNDADADDGNRDYNNQKQLMAEQVSNMDVPLFTDHLTQNVCTTSNEFTSPSCFIQNFQLNENGIHIENSLDQQIQSNTFEAAAEFLIDNVMQPSPESTLGKHPFEHSSRPSSVAEKSAEGTFQNKTYADERNTDCNNQTQLSNKGICNVDVSHPTKDVTQNVGTTSVGFTPSSCFIEDVQENANESSPDPQIQSNTSDGVADDSAGSATQTTQSTTELQMQVLHEKNAEATSRVCSQCQKTFQNVSLLCKHMNQCLKSDEEERHESLMDLARDTNQSALAASCSQAVHQPCEALEKSPWKMCDVCKKLFSCYSALHIHYRSHTKEAPYQCDICGRRFTTKFSRDRHLESQHFIKPRRCYKSRK
ncbi:Homeotic protein spalt-major, partial [Trichinella zimbabwensis]